MSRSVRDILRGPSRVKKDFQSYLNCQFHMSLCCPMPFCSNVYCSMESFCLEVNFAVDFNVSFFFRRKSISGVIDFPTRSQREKTENFSILRRCRKVPKWFIGKLIWDTQQLWQIMCGCEAFFIFPIYIATANISGFQFNYNPTQFCTCPAMSDQTISFVWNGNWKIYLCNSPFRNKPHPWPTNIHMR